jgi:hypothetical protein
MEGKATCLDETICEIFPNIEYPNYISYTELNNHPFTVQDRLKTRFADIRWVNQEISMNDSDPRYGGLNGYILLPAGGKAENR